MRETTDTTDTVTTYYIAENPEQTLADADLGPLWERVGDGSGEYVYDQADGETADEIDFAQKRLAEAYGEAFVVVAGALRELGGQPVDVRAFASQNPAELREWDRRDELHRLGGDEWLKRHDDRADVAQAIHDRISVERDDDGEWRVEIVD